MAACVGDVWKQFVLSVSETGRAKKLSGRACKKTCKQQIASWRKYKFEFEGGSSYMKLAVSFHMFAHCAKCSKGEGTKIMVWLIVYWIR